MKLNRKDLFFTEVVNAKSTLLAGQRRPQGHSELLINSDKEGRQRLKYNKKHLSHLKIPLVMA